MRCSRHYRTTPYQIASSRRMHSDLVILGVATTLLLILYVYPNASAKDSRAPRRTLHGIIDNTVPYRAPLLNCNQRGVIPDPYIVLLKPGHSLERHKQVVGQQVNLLPDIFSVSESGRTQPIVYGANLDDVSLAAVLSDPGVGLVERNRRVYQLNRGPSSATESEARVYSFPTFLSSTYLKQQQHRHRY